MAPLPSAQTARTVTKDGDIAGGPNRRSISPAKNRYQTRANSNFEYP